MKDDEVTGSKAAAANMGDRRQLAGCDRVVRRFDASRPQTQARRETGERQKVRAIPVEQDIAGKGLVIDRNAVMRRHGCDGSEAAVVVLTLPDEGWPRAVPDQNFPLMPIEVNVAVTRFATHFAAALSLLKMPPPRTERSSSSPTGLIIDDSSANSQRPGFEFQLE